LIRETTENESANEGYKFGQEELRVTKSHRHPKLLLVRQLAICLYIKQAVSLRILITAHTLVLR